MKKWSTAFLLLTLVLVLAACGSKPQETSQGSTDTGSKGSTPTETKTAAEPVKLVVGATAVPHAEILNHIKPKLKEEGVELEVKEFTDYVLPNTQLFEKQLDANFFQHQPYLDDQNTKNKFDLVSVIGVHVEPFGAYSKKFKTAEEIPSGAKVAIPNDATNGGRALLLLAKNGLITLKDGVGINATVKDIVTNPKNIEIKELEAAMLPRVLDEVDLALINTNYALEAKLVPTKDALFIEDKESPYTNILVSRPDNKDSEAIQKLAKALTTPEVKKFIEDKYQGSIVPAF
ncbi:MetQ/NlpA family ABC transporter substrate-binding protein [Paenibacillus sp. YPG26]|uniref:MetQ/NlpA family ABC transporter substrate-binding protein n=1 Tax=Paenibacillus sp. YPG26 TaxID=2878915 RepID=UPI00203A6B17|nr:MetQ/NlpA family ABC transporter substrate-binding protein [Paenibacillus sp. YPG26]USB32546.1 MetQ/NlpA family ABC transporter substrate-binding protein [Paenibacillus sp. YPG26]